MSHALLSPSSSKRWLSCTPSARLAELYESTTSAAAEEGTLAHAVCEALLRGEEVPKDATDEMLTHAKRYQEYIDTIRVEKSVLLVEQRVNISEYAPECFGTVDCVISTAEVLHIVDYKYGRGVRVDADRNTQMMMYALGVLYSLDGIIETPKSITMHIYQPRIEDGITCFTMDREELLDWGNTYLKPKAREAFAGGANNFSAGEHCRFCPARGECRALWAYNLKGLNPTTDPNTLTPDEVSQILDKVPVFEIAIRGVQERAMEIMNAGTEVPNYSITEGRSLRKWKDEKEVIKYLTAQGYDGFTDVKLKGIPAIEKIVKDKKEIADLWEKPAGKATISRTKTERQDYNFFNLITSE